MFEAFAITLAALATMQLAPGPNLVVIASTGLSEGRKAALLVTGGIVTGVCLWVLGVAFGIGTLLLTYPVLMTGMKLGGGAYLLWLGSKGILSLVRGGDSKISAVSFTDGQPPHSISHYKRGLLVAMANPKAALAWAA
ncbi:MAG: LysE family translocator, partial [Roseibium sp.]|uniref:LysE family translocator n=1 Tax=Roseibium sp. TaxID=1936156 RepID=UPI00262F5B3D